MVKDLDMFLSGEKSWRKRNMQAERGTERN